MAELTTSEYNFMFSDPIYPEDMYEDVEHQDDPDKLSIHDELLQQEYDEGN